VTFDDDFILLHTESGPRRPTCKSLGITWPPAETLSLHGFKWVRHRMSAISDEDRAAMTHVCRGAEYFPEAR
jgi:hypothetical protein